MPRAVTMPGPGRGPLGDICGAGVRGNECRAPTSLHLQSGAAGSHLVVGYHREHYFQGTVQGMFGRSRSARRWLGRGLSGGAESLWRCVRYELLGQSTEYLSRAAAQSDCGWAQATAAVCGSHEDSHRRCGVVMRLATSLLPCPSNDCGKSPFCYLMR